MSMLLKLSDDQIDQINRYYCSNRGRCAMCGEKITDNHVLVSQPQSWKAEVPGTLKVDRICMSCHRRLLAAFSEGGRDGA